MATIGTCSICGGSVQVPDAWWGTNPPVPVCSKCGATPIAPHGPMIPMRPNPMPGIPQTTDPIVDPDWKTTWGWPVPKGPTCTGTGDIQNDISTGKIKPIQ